MTRALITGSTGFVGGRLVAALLARGDTVRCLVRPTSRRDALLRLGVTDFAEGDVTDPASLRAATADVDVVYHAAAFLKAPWMAEFRAINADGVGHIARACAACPTPPVLIVVSSMAAAGPAHGGPRAEHEPPAPISEYGRCKLDGECQARALAARVPITIVRPPGVFGPGDPYMPQMFNLVRHGLHAIPSDPTARMSMIHVDDLATALLLAADAGERLPAHDDGSGLGVYHVAHPETTSMAELGQLAAAHLGVDRLRCFAVPRSLMWMAAVGGEAVGRLRHRPSLLNLDKIREAWGGDWVCDTRKAVQELGLTYGGTFGQRYEETVRAWAAAHSADTSNTTS